MNPSAADSFQGRAVLRLIHGIERNRRLGLGAIEHTRRLHLKNLVRFSKQRSPFWQQRLEGIDPDRVDLRDIAPTNKPELMENFDESVTDPALKKSEISGFLDDPVNVGRLYLDRFIVAHTSGSTGKRGIFVYDIDQWHLAQALALAGVGELPTGLRDFWNLACIPIKKLNAAIVVPLAGHYTSYLMPLLSSDQKRHLVRMHYIDILKPYSDIVDTLNRIKPVLLHSYPTMTDSLAQSARSKALHIRPRLISAAAEPFPDDIRRRIHQTWPGCVTTDLYGATEVPVMAKQCKAGRLHYNADFLIIENFDRYKNPVPVGQRGDLIYLTNLVNTLQPLIRYEMTDAVRFHQTPCPCGHPLPTLEIFGRTNDTLWIPDATDRWVSLLPTPILVAFMDVPGLRQYQIIQQAPRHLHINFSVDAPEAQASVQQGIQKVFQSYLKRHGLKEVVHLTYSLVLRIERDSRSHKVLQIINRVGPPGGRL